MERYAIVNVPVMTIYTPISEKPSGSGDDSFYGKEDFNEKNFLPVDEELFGNVVKVLEKKTDIAYIMTSCGFFGWVDKTELIYFDECPAYELSDIEDYFALSPLMINAHHADILTIPDVMSCTLITPTLGALVIPVPDDNKTGFTKVLLPDGRCGFVRSLFTEKPKFGYGYLKADTEKMLNAFNLHDRTQSGGDPDFHLSEILDKYYDGDETLFRNTLTRNALSFTDVQYRWAGRSPEGIDCSGLMQLAYLHAGIFINRNSLIKDGFPIIRLSDITDGKEIVKLAREGRILPGDILYFTGHVAMYLGDGLFVHATGHKSYSRVTTNSLYEENPLYRADLIDLLYCFGGVRMAKS